MCTDGYDIRTEFTSTSKGTIKDSQRNSEAYFDPDRPLLSIKLRDPPTGPKLGPHVLSSGVSYVLGCHWSPEEEQKWHHFKANNSLISPISGLTSANETRPYTNEEKAYLKENWGDEYHFLLDHGLSIHKDEDRLEGRSILRAFKDTASDEEFDDDDELGPEAIKPTTTSLRPSWIG